MIPSLKIFNTRLLTSLRVQKFSQFYKKFLIETHELNQLLMDKTKLPQLRILDSTLFLPNDGRNAIEYFQKDRIPYSQFFDINGIADLSTNLPHMMPDEDFFIKEMKKLDIRKSDHIICYDRHGLFSAPRVWFTFRMFGAENVKVLNGGMVKWTEEGLPLEKDEVYNIPVQNLLRKTPKEGDFEYRKDNSKIVNLKKVIELSQKIIHNKTDEALIDGRPCSRFRGEDPEPRPSLRRGHLEGAINIWYKWLLNDKNCYISPKDIEKVFTLNSVNVNKKMSLYCGSGLSAVVVLLGASIIGKYDNCKLYDGSWAECGNKTEQEIAHLKSQVRI